MTPDLPPPALHQTAEAPPATQGEALLRELVAELVAGPFAELQGAHFQWVTFHGLDFNFFCAFWPWDTLVQDRGLDRFLLGHNPRIFEKGFAREELKAVMAHELAHAVMFKRNGWVGNWRLLPVFWDEGANTRFERATDLLAITRGFGPALKAYRERLYTGVDPQALKIKQRDYLSPAEIGRLIEVQAQRPDLLEGWLDDPPLNLADLENRLSAAHQP